MEVTKQIVATKILAYLNHTLNLSDLVAWSEDMILTSSFENGSETELREVLGSLGLIDHKNFGLLWEDCERMMQTLGFKVKIEALLAA